METIWHAAVGYVFLTLIVRVLRRRPGAQMTLAEFVLVFLIGGVIILATVGRDRSVTNCTCAVITVGLMHRLISFLKVRYPKFSAVVDGTPLVLVESGKWKDDVLRGAGLSREDVETSARLNQLHGMEEVDSAVLERNGGISIIKREAAAMAEVAEATREQTVETDIPQRLDRVPWSSWHVMVIVALGTSWLLDGLEVTLTGSLSGVLESQHGLRLTDPQVTAAATTYLAGAVLGALLFGWMTDRLGRRKLFLVTLTTYSIATVATAFSFNFWSFALFRFFTGMGIGGEYAAINSAVDELIPGKVRGTVDLIVNGTFWVGASIGAVATSLLLHAGGDIRNTGWRYAFGIGGVLGAGVLMLRLKVPESPRWLMLRGKEEDAGKIVGEIEQKASKGKPETLPKPEGEKLKLAVRDHTPWGDIFRSMMGENRQRSLLALVLMVGQTFFFNAVFFTYGLVAKRFFHTSDDDIPMRLLPFALGSFFGPLTLGRLFDKIGRKPMITATYGAAGVLLIAALIPFGMGKLGTLGMGVMFTLIFFVASSAASAAYLTVSEIFPLEVRAFAIAMFYAIGTGIGGVGAPLLFGVLIKTNERWMVSAGYALGAVLMLAGSLCEAKIGVEAAGKSLESVSKPLQAK